MLRFVVVGESLDQKVSAARLRNTTTAGPTLSINWKIDGRSIYKRCDKIMQRSYIVLVSSYSIRYSSLRRGCYYSTSSPGR